MVKVETLKKSTVPKSDKVSIATRDNPTTIAGLADGNIILKKFSFVDKPKFFPTSIRLWDWNINDALVNTYTYPNKEKEIELNYDLERNVRLVSFSEGKIDISFNEKLNKNFNLMISKDKRSSAVWINLFTPPYKFEKITGNENTSPGNHKNSAIITIKKYIHSNHYDT